MYVNKINKYFIIKTQLLLEKQNLRVSSLLLRILWNNQRALLPTTRTSLRQSNETKQ